MSVQTIPSAKQSTNTTPPTPVGLAIQGGVIPAGAFAAGVLKGLVEAGAFEKYDIRAFSGTSAGAVVAAVCWGHRLMKSTDEIPKDLEKQWTYLTWPRHLALLPVWTPAWGAAWRELDGVLMKSPLWRLFVEHVRTPFFRWVMTKWIEEVLPIDDLTTDYEYKKCSPEPNGKDLPGLAFGAADVLRGEIKIFREKDLSLSSLMASGSLEEMGGSTTIVTPPHAGTYLDGAWADNPPINELLDYRIDEIWLIQCFPKATPQLPRTPAERQERKNELWQNSLVEHEREFIELINEWHEELNAAIRVRISELQAQGRLPPNSPDPDALKKYLRNLCEKDGALPRDLHRLFDEFNDFEPREYRKVELKKIEVSVPRELGSAIVNAPWFVRNMMNLGETQARDFAARNFGDKPPRPGAPVPAAWATIPSPINDVLFGVTPVRPAADALELMCDFCPRKAASTAGELFLGALPKSMQRWLVEVDGKICNVCPKTLISKSELVA
jgi:predicted acylesterase/phospholipase RssA